MFQLESRIRRLKPGM